MKLNNTFKYFMFKEVYSLEMINSKFKEELVKSKFLNLEFVKNIDDITFHYQEKYRLYYELECSFINIPYNIINSKETLNSYVDYKYRYVDPLLIKNDLYRDGFIYEANPIEFVSSINTISGLKSFNSIKSDLKYIMADEIKTIIMNKIQNSKTKLDIGLPHEFNYSYKNCYIEKVYEVEYIFNNKKYYNRISSVTGNIKYYDLPYSDEFKKFMKKNMFNNFFFMNKHHRQMFFTFEYDIYLKTVHDISIFKRFEIETKIKKQIMNKDNSERIRYAHIGYYLFNKKCALKVLALEKEELLKGNYKYFDLEYYLLLLSKVDKDSNVLLSEYALMLLLSGVRSRNYKYLKYLKRAARLHDGKSCLQLYEHYSNYRFYNLSKKKKYLKLAKKYEESSSLKIT